MLPNNKKNSEYPRIAYVLSLNGHCNNNCEICICKKKCTAPRSIDEIVFEAERVRPYFNGFIITDGEPAMLEDLPLLLKKLSKLEPEVLQVHTNARMFSNKSVLDKLSDVCGVDYVVRVFSHIPEAHDFLTRAEGSCLQTFKGLKNLASRRPERTGVHIEIPLTRRNASQIPTLIKAISSLQPDSIMLTGGYPAAKNNSVSEEEAAAIIRDTGIHASGIPVVTHYATEKRFIDKYHGSEKSVSSGLYFVGADANNPFVFRRCGSAAQKALLLYAPYDTQAGNNVFIAAPLSLGSIKAFLSALGYECNLIDLEVRCRNRNIDFVKSLKGCWFIEEGSQSVDREKDESTMEKVFDDGELTGYSAIGISMIEHFQAVFSAAIAGYIRKVAPEAEIAVGSVRPEEFEYYEGLSDCLCKALMFGEYCFAGLMNRIEYGDRSAVAIYGRDTDAQKESGGDYLSMPCNLKLLPTPDFTTLDVAAYRLPFTKPLETFLNEKGIRHGIDDRVGLAMYDLGKGCVFKCVFCSYHGNFIIRDPKMAANDMARIAERTGLKGFHLLDAAINSNPRALEIFCAELIRSGANVLWNSSACLMFKDDSLPTMMRAAGCVLLTTGLESGSDKILKLMNKSFNSSLAEKSLGFIARACIVNQINLMSGFFHERPEDVDMTVDFIRRNLKYIDLMSNHSSFVWYENMRCDPSAAGVEFSGEILDTPSGRARVYNEKGGMKWPDILNFKRDAYLRIEKEIARCRQTNRFLSEIDIFNIFNLGFSRDMCVEYFNFLAKYGADNRLSADEYDYGKYEYRLKAFFGE